MNARKWLLINPNTQDAVTDRLLSVLRPLLPHGVVLDARTARFGAPYIACEASHALAAHACLQAWAEHRQSSPEALDGVIIACFGDPGLFALREASACPVTGLAEASFILAAQKGPFAVVTGGERWGPMLRRLAQSLGYADKLLHIETVQASGAQLLADPVMAHRCLDQACAQAAAIDGVQSVILGGAGLAGYAQDLQPSLSVPLIDSAQAGLQVMVRGLAPASAHLQDGFHAQWQGLHPAFSHLPVRS